VVAPLKETLRGNKCDFPRPYPAVVGVRAARRRHDLVPWHGGSFGLIVMSGARLGVTSERESKDEIRIRLPI